MSAVKAYCVICGKRTKPLIPFSDDTLSKCSNVLKIRKENNLSKSEAVLLSKIEEYLKYAK